MTYDEMIQEAFLFFFFLEVDCTFPQSFPQSLINRTDREKTDQRKEKHSNFPRADSRELIIMTTVFNVTKALMLPLQSTVRWHKSTSEKVADSMLEVFNTPANL